MICPPCVSAALMRLPHSGCRGCPCAHHIGPYPAPETPEQSDTEDDDGE